MVMDFMSTGLAGISFCLFLFSAFTVSYYSFLFPSLSSLLIKGWMESVYTVLGEVAFYFFALLASVICFTLYYAESIKPQEYATTPTTTMANTEL
jgi:hypothetical protein